MERKPIPEYSNQENSIEEYLVFERGSEDLSIFFALMDIDQGTKLLNA